MAEPNQVTDDRSYFEKLTDQLVREAKKANAIDRERCELMEAMLKTPAWRSYIELLGLRIQAFGDQVLAPAGSVDGALSLEYLKGAMSGMIIARDLPTVIIAATREMIPAPENTDA